MIDSSSVRAHRCAVGSRKDGEPRETGCSRGGRATKIHAMVDGKGGLRRMRLPSGQAADRAEAAALFDGLEASCALIADKSYDADAAPKQAAETGCWAVIPSKSNRRRQRPLDEAACAARDVIGRFFGRIKSSGGSRPALTSGCATSPPLSPSPSSAACRGMPQS